MADPAHPTFARTMLKPRWLALLALVLAVIYSFGLLGLWQMNVAQDTGREQAQAEALARPVVPIDTVLKPHQAMNEDASARMVVVEGTYDASRQLLITDRRLGDRDGYWVVTPLKTQDGAVVSVLRGFVEQPNGASLPPATPVSVTGMLAPNEGPPDERRALPANQLQQVDLGDLVNRWPEDLYNGFIFATVETPTLSWGPGSALTAVPPPNAAPTELNWRNLSYAAQWWVFALFAAYMWWRMVREDVRRAGEEAEFGNGAAGPPGTSTGPPGRPRPPDEPPDAQPDAYNVDAATLQEAHTDAR